MLMKKMQFNAEYQVYENEQKLPLAARELLAQAKKACDTAYAPYSNFKVGAAAQLENGAIVLGSNQENAAYPVTICGERNAIFAASVQYPEVPIVAVAITVRTQKQNLQKPVPPCGSCRQAMYEYELRHQQPIQLILQGDTGEVYIIDSIKDILPLFFDPSYLF